MIKFISLSLPIFFTFSCPALAGNGGESGLLKEYSRFDQISPYNSSHHVHNSSMALKYSAQTLYAYLNYNYSASAYRVVMGAEIFLKQLNEFTQQQYGFREEVFYVNRAFRRLSDNWRKYCDILDPHAKFLYKNVENNLKELNSVTGGRGSLPIPSIPRP